MLTLRRSDAADSSRSCVRRSPIAKHGGRWIFSSVISLLETLAQQRHKAMHRAFRNISRLHLCYMSNKTMDCTGHLSLQGE